MPVLYGYLEAWARQSGNLSGHKVFFGQFGLYHLCMLFMFVFYNLLVGEWFNINWMHAFAFMPLTVLVQDYSYFLFHPTDNLDENDWVNWHFGGFKLDRHWVPTIYVILFFGGAVLLTLFHIFVG